MKKLTIREWAIRTFGGSHVVADIVEALDSSGYETTGVFYKGRLYPFGRSSETMYDRIRAAGAVKHITKRPNSFAFLEKAFTITRVVIQIKECEL